MSSENSRASIFRAVEQQLAAFPVDEFEVGIHLPGDPPRMLLRRWQPRDILNAVPWLDRKNRLGASIYVRPHGEHPLSLVDDLDAASLGKMLAEGFEPCVVIETSPGNHQAWLNHGRTLPREISTPVARALAQRFGGDPGAADWRHFGRLAGFENRKPKYRREDGSFPQVLVTESRPGLVYREAADFVASVEATKQRAARESVRRVQALSRTTGSRPLKSIADFHGDPRYSGDLSRADLAYAVYAIGRGVPPEDVRGALSARDLTKKGHPARIEDYLRRTVEKAIRQVARTGRVVDCRLELGR